MPYGHIAVYGKIQGQAAAAPIRAPVTVSSTSSAGFMEASHNFVSLVAADITRRWYDKTTKAKTSTSLRKAG